MPARYRVRVMSQRPAVSLAAAIVAGGLALTACGSGDNRPSGVATNPTVAASGEPAGSTTSPGTQTSGARTVLSPIGINIRNADAPAATQVGTAAQGALLTVLDHSDRNGGWYKVRGQSTVGWITADPDLTAPGHFSTYSTDSPQFSFSALYPDGWTFANEPGDVIFKPQSGDEAVVVRPGPSLAALGASGRAGYSAQTQTDEVVCGITGTVVGYDREGSASAAPQPSSPPAGGPPVVAAAALAHLAQLRLRVDATHAYELDYNYDVPDHVQTFRNFYHSMTFPVAQCLGPAAATPAPAAPATPRNPNAPL